jgi:protoheme IX farnesyltransferase
MKERLTVKAYINIVLRLSKVRITIAVALTTITGYVLGRASFDFGFLAVTAGIFFLACGSSVLNHLQEYRTDSLMERTSKRPLPTGVISRFHALMIAVVEILTGSLILVFLVNTTALILGLLALVWYNLIYTPMKKVTPHAVIPGSFIGAIPPLAGWVAGGASLFTIQALAMALFFFVWQVPHFYLLSLKFGPQYERAGFPTLAKRHSDKNLRLLVLVWVIFTSITALLLYYFYVVTSLVSVLLLLASSLWLIGVFLLPVVRRSVNFKPIRYFMKFNYYVLFVILVLNFDHIFSKIFF